MPVSSEAPAAHLARLKLTHAGWRIERSATGTGYSAHNRDKRAAPNLIYAPTLGELETALHETAPGNGSALGCPGCP
jgi:hypothetical protein